MTQKQNSGFFALGLALLTSLKGRYPWLTLIFWAVLGSTAQAIELRVAIEKNVSQVKVGSSTPAIVKDGAGRKLGELQPLDSFAAQPSGRGVTIGGWQGSQLVIEPSGDGYVWIGDRWYRGKTRLMRQGQGIIAINLVDLEQYLYSVVGSEAIPTWPLEALKAQAVAARTYALYKSSTGGNRFYDLDTSTQTQVYKGLQSEYVSTHDAVEGTTGQVMTYRGKVILALFHASSGGHTENVEDVWNNASLPYLRGVVDYDQVAPVFQWKKDFSANQLSRLIGGVGMVRSLITQRTTPQGRILALKVVGDRGSKQLTGVQLRKVLDLRSTLFTVSANSNTFEIDGRGYGHGIGLSQWGTYSLAEQGISYDQILSYYYQNTSLNQFNSVQAKISQGQEILLSHPLDY